MQKVFASSVRRLRLSVARGRTNAEIAEELHITVSAVNAHVAALMNKIGARNRVEVAMWTYETKWVKESSRLTCG